MTALFIECFQCSRLWNFLFYDSIDLMQSVRLSRPSATLCGPEVLSFIPWPFFFLIFNFLAYWETMRKTFIFVFSLHIFLSSSSTTNSFLFFKYKVGNVFFNSQLECLNQTESFQFKVCYLAAHGFSASKLASFCHQKFTMNYSIFYVTMKVLSIFFSKKVLGSDNIIEIFH